MADVATGVLHNVGNVLNSVSVSPPWWATVAALQGHQLCRATAMLARAKTVTSPNF